MRIGLIYHQFTLRGGLEGYLIEFASRLRAAGHELHLLTAEMDEAVEKALAATVHRVGLTRSSPTLRLWQFERKASLMAAQLPVDVTIGFGRTTTHDLHRAGGGCHAVYSQLLPPLKRWGLKNRLELALEKKLYTSDLTKLFIVNSAQVAGQLSSVYGTAHDRFRVLHTAVDSAKYRPAEDRETLRAMLCAQMQTDPRRPAFLFVAMSHRRKGLDVLLDIWPEVDADLWIVGKVPGFLDRWKMKRRGLAGKLRIIPARRNISALYQAADWFIHPTLYDACANTVLQSMACGLPGLISVNDGATDHLRDGENGLLLAQPADAASVLERVRAALAMEPSQREAMGAAARETMLPLTWDAHLEKWMGVIHELGDRH